MHSKLSHHIATLLRRHDCVIVPGVGAFVATRESAAVTPDGLLTPPVRRISFNGELTHDDGLLASSVGRHMKISFEQARERVSAESALIHRRLRAEGAVRFDRVGTLQRMSGGLLDFLPDSPWTLPLPPVREAKAAPALEITPADDGRDDCRTAIVRLPLRVRWMRVAAAAIVLLTLGFTLSTPIDIEQAQHASLAAPAFTPPEPEVYESPAAATYVELQIAVSPEAGIIRPDSKPEPEVAAKPLPYVMVVASLPSRQKAEEYIAERSLPGLQIMQNGDKFRVYASQGATPEEARLQAEKISGFQVRFPDAWVCRR